MHGPTLASSEQESKEDCAQECRDHPDCGAWTFSYNPVHKPGCWLKSNADDTRANPDFVWGPKECSDGSSGSSGPMKTFTLGCVDSPNPSVVDAYQSNDLNEEKYFGRNVLTKSNPEVEGTFWVFEMFPGVSPHLVLDLHCVTLVTGVEVVNTHGGEIRMGSTKAFSIWLAMSEYGPWAKGTEITNLEDSNVQEDPLPLLSFIFQFPIRARFLKLIVLESHDGNFGGLQYLNPTTGE